MEYQGQHYRKIWPNAFQKKPISAVVWNTTHNFHRTISTTSKCRCARFVHIA